MTAITSTTIEYCQQAAPVSHIYSMHVDYYKYETTICIETSSDLIIPAGLELML